MAKIGSNLHTGHLCSVFTTLQTLKTRPVGNFILYPAMAKNWFLRSTTWFSALWCQDKIPSMKIQNYKKKTD